MPSPPISATIRLQSNQLSLAIYPTGGTSKQPINPPTYIISEVYAIRASKQHSSPIVEPTVMSPFSPSAQPYPQPSFLIQAQRPSLCPSSPPSFQTRQKYTVIHTRTSHSQPSLQSTNQSFKSKLQDHHCLQIVRRHPNRLNHFTAS